MFSGYLQKQVMERDPMDGLGAFIKQSIKDTIPYNRNGIISNTEKLIQYVPHLSNICVSTYNEDDMISYRKLLPDMDDLEIIESGGFGIPKVHGTFMLREDRGIFYIGKRFP